MMVHTMFTEVVTAAYLSYSKENSMEPLISSNRPNTARRGWLWPTASFKKREQPFYSQYKHETFSKTRQRREIARICSLQDSDSRDKQIIESLTKSRQVKQRMQ